MSSRPTALRLSSSNTLSHRGSTETIGDVFSDDFALESSVTGGNAPSSHVPAPEHQYFDHPYHEVRSSSNVDVIDTEPEQRYQDEEYDGTASASYPIVPVRESDAVSTRSWRSAQKPSWMPDGSVSRQLGSLNRALSTSSRMSFNRTPSPYNGPMAPSQPYAMYPQVTRAASIMSRSDIESSVLPVTGPSQPYSLYPQTTLPEEEDEDITSRGIPVGFPTNFAYPASSSHVRSEVGDIVNPDGHIESLPPYSRYADNTVAKGNMDRINSHRLSRRPTNATLRSHHSAAGVSVNVPPSTTAHTSTSLLHNLDTDDTLEDEEHSPIRKGWRWRAQQETWCGMKVWVAIVLVLTIVGAGLIGGIIGGVIGRQQGAETAWAQGAMTTTTMWLDARPTSLSPDTPAIPTGDFQIPLNQTAEIKNCIGSSLLTPAWGCMDIAYIGIDIFRPSPNAPVQAVFEDFSVNTANFRYGPQPPDFNGTAFDLEPMSDKDNDWGVAMFFSVLFDKLSILPEKSIHPVSNKRSVDEVDIVRRAADYDGRPLRPSDKPWFCFWNSTITEFFIYLEQPAPPVNRSTTSEVSSLITSSPSVGPSPSSPSSLVQQAPATTPASTQTATTFPAYNPVKPTPTWDHKRDYDVHSPLVSDYPRLIRMVEKRKQNNTVRPYCQQMQVLDNYQIVPIAGAAKVIINEISWTPSSATTSIWDTNNKRDPDHLVTLHKRDNLISELQSNCICDWRSY